MSDLLLDERDDAPQGQAVGPRLGEAAESGKPPAARIDAPEDAGDEQTPADDREPVRPLTASVAALLATAAAGWMLGGVFAGWGGRAVGLTAPLLGAVLVALSYRWARAGWLQIAALPAGVVVGSALALNDATEGIPQLPRFVREAVQAGGLANPPIAFDPGWRILLVVFLVAMVVAAATSAVVYGRGRLAVAVPTPFLVAGALIQPTGAEVMSVVGGAVLAVAALAVAYGGELSRDSATGVRFEARRLGRAVVFLAVITGVAVGMSQLGFLFPEVQRSQVVPPKRPETAPPVDADKHLFTATMERSLPLRLGVLDVYDGTAWLTPPFDQSRLVPVGDGDLPASEASGDDVAVTIEIVDIGQQREVPTLAGAVRVDDAMDDLLYDPRTNTLRVQARVRGGTTYTVVAAPAATADDLREAGEPSAEMSEFLEVPDPPPAVRALLQEAPADVSLFQRLQFVRNRFFETVVASGVGDPVDIPPARVSEMLQGDEATPYEITAAEVLLARWAGVPARVGFGYYVADENPEGVYDVTPVDGAMWLEAHFDGVGWVPILGRPQQARASLSDEQKQQTGILPSGELAAQLYVPVRQTSIVQFYAVARYWLVRGVGVAAGLFALWLGLPWLAKVVRSHRRRRWADARGPRARVGVAYAEFRDRAIDLNIGHPSLAPLEFLDVVVPDSDHNKFAWLTTRVLWGDLRRDPRIEDAEIAEALSRSLIRRLTAKQPLVQRVIGHASRVSLREPFSAEPPNFWWQLGIRRRARRVGRTLVAAVTLRRIRRRFGSVSTVRRGRTALRNATFLLVALLSGGCVNDIDVAAITQLAGPMPTLPAAVGEYRLTFEEGYDDALKLASDQALIGDLDFYTIQEDGLTVGTLQISALKAGLEDRRAEVLEGVLRTIGGTPEVVEVVGERVYTVEINELRLFLNFAPDGATYQVLAAGPEFSDPESAFVAILAAQRGDSIEDVEQRLDGVPVIDARRGLE